MTRTKSKEPDKIQEMINLSEEILTDLEMGKLSLENIISKCMRLARLRHDFDAVKWLTLELNGYNKNSIPPGIKEEDLFDFAQRSLRTFLSRNIQSQKEEQKYWIYSISELESMIETNKTQLNSLRPPEKFVPAVSQSSSENEMFGKRSSQLVIETYQNALQAINNMQNFLSNNIQLYKSILSKIQTSIYNYVMNINYQLKFESITESIFQETKEKVDKKLSEICPGAMKKFVAAYDRLKSDNPEEWSQAMSSCRNVLKEFADHVFSARNEKYKMKNGDEIEVTDDKYKNRIIAFIDEKLSGKKRKFLEARASDLICRIHSLHDLLSKGTHAELNKEDVNICILDTYLLLGSLLSLID